MKLMDSFVAICLGEDTYEAYILLNVKASGVPRRVAVGMNIHPLRADLSEFLNAPL